MAVLLLGGGSAKAPASSLRASHLPRRGTESLVAWQYLPVAKNVPNLKTLRKISLRCPTRTILASRFAGHGRFCRGVRAIAGLIGHQSICANHARMRAAMHTSRSTFGAVLARSSQSQNLPPEDCQIRQVCRSPTLIRIRRLEIPTRFSSRLASCRHVVERSTCSADGSSHEIVLP